MIGASREDNWYVPAYLFLFFLSIYLLTASEPRFFTDVGIARIEVLKSFFDRFDLSVPYGVGIKGVDGREYSLFSIGSVVVAVPFYLMGLLIGISPWNFVAMMNQLAGAGTVVFIFLFSTSLGYSRRSSLYVSLLYGLCTIAWYYSKDPGDHALETLFILLSVYFMFRYSADKKVLCLILSIFFFGFAFITRPTSLLILPSLLILMAKIFYDPKGFDIKIAIMGLTKKIILFCIVFFPFLALTLWYNFYRFGSIFETGYSLMGARLGLDFFTGTPFLTGLIGFLISPGKGFFYYSPVAVLFFFSIRSFTKNNLLPGLSFIFIIIFYLFFMSKNVYWHGDWAWGPRYLFVITPFFIIPTAELFESKVWNGKKHIIFLIVSISIISLFIQIAAVSVRPYKYFFSLQFEDNIKFIIVDGVGVRPIVEPPLDTYFDWSKSPILAQFKYLIEITKKSKIYIYNQPSNNKMFTEKIKSAPWFNVFDFWWYYRYIFWESYSGFIVAMFMLFLAVFSLLRLWKVFR